MLRGLSFGALTGCSVYFVLNGHIWEQIVEPMDVLGGLRAKVEQAYYAQALASPPLTPAVTERDLDVALLPRTRVSELRQSWNDGVRFVHSAASNAPATLPNAASDAFQAIKEVMGPVEPPSSKSQAQAQQPSSSSTQA
ncbi:hypothetical protein CAOG_01434 [Capsaspora owczarzaki ATCC 30864]|uniref:MICOS complex subunit MIC13 n=1 Tax=Capsaspora owczarzaki (strain ATCC 30864) TaxID=595528 RepID=A0A0D2WKF5_CAPO3|nr:hypothetical protein CAOG_01434 [Capsaspora owczarzaki ATCC 30864]KJE90058.1 hypothetical protein CAOG_001434 [Capsaspora owczarzaki ATCC 30864]|eukprot:XP_004349954.1 hypothetical protein CAOG_01434 [Capsaspora owczarzaki ATCC 30864]